MNFKKSIFLLNTESINKKIRIITSHTSRKHHHHNSKDSPQEKANILCSTSKGNTNGLYIEANSTLMIFDVNIRKYDDFRTVVVYVINEKDWSDSSGV